jgi:subtilisin family serine protease
MVGFAPYTAADRLSRELTPGAIAVRAAQPEVAVMVHVMPGRDRAAVRAAVEARGGRVVGDGTAGAFGRLAALFSRDTVADEMRLLAERSDLFFLERIHRLGLFNDRLVGTVQSGQQGHDIAQTPIWTHGIRGENQIVGEIDTGIDANSCYFNDAALPVTNTWSNGGGYGTSTGSTHRKIVAYDFLYSCDQYPTGMNCETPANLTQWDTQGHGRTWQAGGGQRHEPRGVRREDAIAPAARSRAGAGYRNDTCAELPRPQVPCHQPEPLFEHRTSRGGARPSSSMAQRRGHAAVPSSNYTRATVDTNSYGTHKDFLTSPPPAITPKQHRPRWAAPAS